MTLGQLFLGLVTLVVATFVYRWQKSVDRQTAFHAELRQQLASFRFSTEALYECHSDSDPIKSKAEMQSLEDKNSRELSYIALFAPRAIFEAAEFLSTITIDLEFAESEAEKAPMYEQYSKAIQKFDQVVRTYHEKHLGTEISARKSLLGSMA